MRKNFTEEDKEQIKDLYLNQSKSVREIAALFDKSEAGVFKCLKRMGVKLRDFRAAIKLHWKLHPYPHTERVRERIARMSRINADLKKSTAKLTSQTKFPDALQAQFEACLNAVRQERACASWRNGVWLDR